MRIRITEENHLWALLLEKRVEATETLKYDNPTGLSEPARYFKGYIGELCLETLLISAKIRFRFKPRTDGLADKSDFWVWSGRTGDELTVDVKTAGRTDFMMPENQWQRKRSKIYVGARLNLEGGYVEFMGWATQPEVAAFEVKQLKVLTRLAPFAGLRSMKSLLKGLERGERQRETYEQDARTQPSGAEHSTREVGGVVPAGDVEQGPNTADRAGAKSRQHESAGAGLFS